TRPGSYAWLTSWGAYTAANILPANLQQAELYIDSGKLCENRYPGFFDSQHICAGGQDGKSTCYNDEGGP
ncbi:hypothetical protein PFISCL1PPCAC_7434, partial [Pristionchus fissidentatus]